MKRWYALRCKARKEPLAATVLATAGLAVYLPQITNHPRSGTTPTVEPFFPGYLFASLDPDLGEMRLAKYATGVLYVVGGPNEPWPVPDDVVAEVQQRITRTARPPALDHFRSGDRVIITSGPLRDIEAIFDRALSPSGRVCVLIRMLERLCRAELHVAHLHLAANPAGQPGPLPSREGGSAVGERPLRPIYTVARTPGADFR
jgi:transcriptional antiterminator RfaH